MVGTEYHGGRENDLAAARCAPAGRARNERMGEERREKGRCALPALRVHACGSKEREIYTPPAHFVDWLLRPVFDNKRRPPGIAPNRTPRHKATQIMSSRPSPGFVLWILHGSASHRASFAFNGTAPRILGDRPERRKLLRNVDHLHGVKAACCPDMGAKVLGIPNRPVIEGMTEVADRRRAVLIAGDTDVGGFGILGAHGNSLSGDVTARESTPCAVFIVSRRPDQEHPEVKGEGRHPEEDDGPFLAVHRLQYRSHSA
jgi:hypothetical protein